jgi:hypothetical protein
MLVATSLLKIDGMHAMRVLVALLVDGVARCHVAHCACVHLCVRAHTHTHRSPPPPCPIAVLLQLRMRLMVQKANSEMMAKDMFLAGT